MMTNNASFERVKSRVGGLKKRSWPCKWIRKFSAPKHQTPASEVGLWQQVLPLIGISGVSRDNGGRCTRFRGRVVGNAGVMGDSFSEVFDMEDEVDAAEKCPLGKLTDSSMLGPFRRDAV